MQTIWITKERIDRVLLLQKAQLKYGALPPEMSDINKTKKDITLEKANAVTLLLSGSKIVKK